MTLRSTAAAAAVVFLLTLVVAASLFAAGPTAVPDSPADLPKGPPPPPVPLLRADEAIATMELATGFRIETVAEEPLVQHPVAMTFDADGRIWVVEMRSYMPDLEGNGEQAPTGRVKMLEDLDGDGRMDKSTVFLDQLVLPRAIAIVRDGVLVAAPPRLLFCRDTNGDGKADEQHVVATDYGVRGNPEHMPNGLMHGLDNWIYSANYDKRIRLSGGAWRSEVVPELGQWGVAQDDYGRLYHNTNTDQLRASLIPPHYADRNPHYRTALSVNEQVAKDQTVWPAHATAVDRGYLPALMRPDGTLRNFTAACAPLVYRGGLFPEEFRHNAFVCEPAANLIKRNLLTEREDGTLLATNAYGPRQEFLRSSYERFRPVNLNVGPDGALYVVDMHHGLIQHKTYLTTYCAEQYEAKALNKHMMTGRLYRIVPEGAPRPLPIVKLSKATTPQLIEHLAHANGQVRDTAQRLLVERGDVRALSPLRRTAAKHENPLARLHALWTLDGMRVRDPNVILGALRDPDPKLRAAAIRLAEPLLASPIKEKATAAVLKLVNDPRPEVRLQFALTMGGLGTPAGDAAVLEVLSAAASIAAAADKAADAGKRDVEKGGSGGDADQDANGNEDSGDGDDAAAAERQGSGKGGSDARRGAGDGSRYLKRPEPTLDAAARVRDAILTGVRGRELDLLGRLTGGPGASQPQAGRAELIAALSRCVVSEGSPRRVARLLEMVAEQPAGDAWRRVALLDGFAPPAGQKRARPGKAIVLEEQPTAFLRVSDDASGADPSLRAALKTARARIHWPGEPGYTPPPPPPPLTERQQASFERGRLVYAATCAACHKPTGVGQPGLAPPLLESEWVLGPPGRLARIVLHGVTGPITVEGQTYNLDMPGLGKLSDGEIADVITYVRRAWEHGASPVSPNDVKKIRATTRPTPWTERELLQVR